MGRFIYDLSVRVDFEDRLLAHLQAVIMAKIRRNERFLFTWKDDMSTGGGRTAVFLQPSVSLVFILSTARTPQLNRAWLDALTATANSPGGLIVVPEPDGVIRPLAPASAMVSREVRADVPVPQRP